MKKVSWIVVIAGAVVGLAAVVLTHLGNPANMGFCIACFLRDITGAVGMHSAAKVQYVRPEIIGLVLGAFIMSVVMVQKAVKADAPAALEVLVDNQCSVENVTRFAENSGYKVSVAAEGQDFRLCLNK